MITPAQLKGQLKNLAIKHNVSVQFLLQKYMQERLLCRIAKSTYADKFVLKGGFLVSVMTGIDQRTTMDVDATVKDFPLSQTRVADIFVEILSIPCDDQVSFTLDTMEDIRENDVYSGLRLKFSALYPPLKVPLKMDLTTGDSIYPHTCQLDIVPMFSDENIQLTAYCIENVLAEKLETILSRGNQNTRPRDFYDVWLLTKHTQQKISYDTLKIALRNTMEHRGTGHILPDAISILEYIAKSHEMREYWRRYQQSYSYASECIFEETLEAVKELLRKLQ
jgi:predicted nucleotidyltransferase component of viral defense system